MADEDIIKRIKALEDKVNYPIDINFQKTLEKAFFNEMNIKVMKGGLPIYSVARVDNLKEGELWIYDDGVNFQIKFYSNGATHSIVAI